jgi:hypothetical protein
MALIAHTATTAPIIVVAPVASAKPVSTCTSPAHKTTTAAHIAAAMALIPNVAGLFADFCFCTVTVHVFTSRVASAAAHHPPNRRGAEPGKKKQSQRKFQIQLFNNHSKLGLPISLNLFLPYWLAMNVPQLGKKTKLALLGIAGFVVALFVITMFTTPPSDNGFKMVPISEEVAAQSALVEISEKGGFTQNQPVIVARNSVLQIRVLNNDSAAHKLFLLAGNDLNKLGVIDEFSVEPGAYHELRVVNYEKEEEMAGLSFDIMLLSCSTCDTENNQLNIVAKTG